MNYHNQRVLVFSSGENFGVMKKLCVHGKTHWDWEINIVVNSEYMKPHKNFIASKDHLALIPNFLKKQKWEDDPAEWKKISELMRKCEAYVGVPINRIFLGDERLLGRPYSNNHYFWPGNKVIRKVLSNKDLSYTIMMRIFKFADDVLRDLKPTLCFGFAPGVLTSTVFFYLLQYYRIPNLTCMFSPLTSHSHYWSVSWRIENDELSKDYLERVASAKKPEKASMEYIEKFRESPGALPIYDGMWNRASKSVGLIGIIKLMTKSVVARGLEIVRKVKVSNPPSLLKFFFSTCHSAFSLRINKLRYKTYTDEALSKFKYIYYPCHQDPELVLNIRAPFWHNQLNTIKMLSYNLPIGYKLLVREHCNNVARRPVAYIKEMKSYPGVEVVDAFDSQYKYIKNADLVVTVNGMSGFEGILLKRPVLTLDKTFYDVLQYAHSYSSGTDLGEVMLKCIKEHNIPSNYDDRIAMLVEAEKKQVLHDDATPEAEMLLIQSLVEKYYFLENSDIECLQQ